MNKPTKSFNLTLQVQADAAFPDKWIADYVKQVLSTKVLQQETTIITEVTTCDPINISLS